MSLAVLLLAAGSAACGPQPQDCVSPRVFCVGLVTDYGGVTTGIAHEAWLALEDAKAAGIADRIDRIETVDTRDRQANIEVFASKGYDMIVTVGFSIGDETTAEAKQHPSLMFVGVEQPQAASLPNLTGLVFHEERSGFLAGVLAALTTRTHRVAAVCESEYLNQIRRYCEGFRAGSEYADPTVSVSVAYRNGSSDLVYHDAVWGKATATEVLQQGADVVLAAGADTAAAALETAAAQGALVIGSETDLYTDLPGLRPRLLASAESDIRGGLLGLLRLGREKRFPGGQYFGQTGLSGFHDLDASVSAATRARILEVEQALSNGSLQLDIPYDND